MYCSKCGAQLPDAAGFCTNCGAAQGGLPLVAAAAATLATAVTITPAMPSPYAGFWLRFVAFVIDEAILVLGVGILGLLAVVLVGFDSLRAAFEGLDNNKDRFPVELMLILGILALAGTLMWWLYHAWMESSPNQGTLGKMALGLVVTDTQGRRVTFARATGRFFARIVTGMIPLFFGYILAGVTEKKQALHDIIASCLVLRKS
jgi:uncharacterized RDD family membrane protein YckC